MWRERRPCGRCQRGRWFIGLIDRAPLRAQNAVRKWYSVLPPGVPHSPESTLNPRKHRSCFRLVAAKESTHALAQGLDSVRDRGGDSRPAGCRPRERPGRERRRPTVTHRQPARPAHLAAARAQGTGPGGQAQRKAYGRTKQVARGQYVELERQGEGAVWTVLGDFADYQHNNMPHPDRTVNNTTIWVPDFSRDYFMDLLFNDAPGANSMRNFYIEQSSGRYTVHGDVTDWVRVPGTRPTTTTTQMGDRLVWEFIQDTVNGWYDEQIAAGKTPAEINAYLSQFDKSGTATTTTATATSTSRTATSTRSSRCTPARARRPAAGRWARRPSGATAGTRTTRCMGIDGPSFNKFGGVQIGNSDYWVGKYTIQPENGGVGVFVHEFGHDLGPAGPLRHRRRRQRHRLLDPDVLGLLAGRRHGHDRQQVQPHGSLGEVPARLAELRGGARRPEVRAQARPDGVQHEAGAGPVRHPSEEGRRQRTSAHPTRARTTTTAARATTWTASCTSRSPSRLARRWPPRSSTTSSWTGTMPTSCTRPTTARPGQTLATSLSTTTNPNSQNFGHGITGVSAGWVDLTATLPGRQRAARLPLQDRRQHRRLRLHGGRHRRHRLPDRRRRDRRGLDVRPDGRLPRHHRYGDGTTTTTTTWASSASTGATIRR